MKTTVKRLLAFCLVAIIFAGVLTSCETAKQYTAFDVDYTIPPTSFSYPTSILKSGEVILHSGQININLDSLLFAHNIPSGWIESAQYNQFELTITSPEGSNLGWLQSANVEVSDSASFTNSSIVASGVVTDSTSAKLQLTTNNVELQPYIHKSSFHYRVVGFLNGSLPYETINMMINSGVRIHVEPL